MKDIHSGVSHFMSFNNQAGRVTVPTSESTLVFSTTIVWEKLVAGNIHEKKIHGKKLCISRLQTIIIINYPISLW